MKQAVRLGMFLFFMFLLLLPRAVGEEKRQPINFKFEGEECLKGWAVTKQATAIPRGDHLEIQGNGWDAKIYRVIQLPAGRYVAFGRASGTVMIKIMGTDWKTIYLPFNLSTSKDAWKTDGEGWRIDYRDFEVPGGEVYLVVQVHAEKGIAKIQSLKIESAPIKAVEKGTPLPKVLARQAARLPIARGFMVGYLKSIDGHFPPIDGNVFVDMRNWGANVARLNIWPPLAWPRMANPKDFWDKGLSVLLDELEANVKLAHQAGIRVALDCHFPPPVKGRLLDHGTSKFWQNTETTDSMCRLWKAIAERLRPYRSSIYGYDLFNEPLDWGQIPFEPREWRGMAIEIIKAIRSVDKDTWIIYEPGPGGLLRGFEGLVPLPDTRVIYSPHFYFPAEFCAQGITAIEGTDLPKIMEATNIRYPSTIKGILWDKNQLEKMLAPVDEFQRKWRVPIYVGEFSVIRWAPGDDAVRWLTDVIDLFEARGWSWSYHAFRENTCWSLEHDEKYRAKDTPAPSPVKYETERAKVIKNALKKNRM